MTSHGFSETTFGVLFGVSAGMLTFLSIKGNLPTAYKHDPRDKVTSMFLFLGMLVIVGALGILAAEGSHSHSEGGDDGGDDDHGHMDGEEDGHDHDRFF
jgi:hypothetical protein